MNNARNGKKRFIYIAWIVLVMSIGIMLLSGFKLWETHQTYQIGDNSYKSLSDLVRPAGKPDTTAGATTPATSANTATDKPGKTLNVEIPDMEIDFQALHSINPDSVAWLYSPDTVIDYPVVRATEYDYYLHRLPDGTYNANGTLFIDYNWKGFSDKLTVIYGHNMKSGKMFGSLTNYKKQAYFDEHPYLYLYAEDGSRYRIDLLYGCVIGAGQWRERAFMFDLNLESLISYGAYNTTFNSPAKYTPGDQIVVLSTCSYEFDDARYVVMGILQPEYK